MLEKAIKVLKCTEPEQIPGMLNGRKITSFFHCIMGDQSDVCVDGHAYSIWVGDRLTMKQVPNIGKKLYQTITDDYIFATKIINARHNLNLKHLSGSVYHLEHLEAYPWRVRFVLL